MSNKTPRQGVLVTGAGKRIGRVIALDFARAGWNVAIHYGRSQAEAEHLVGEIEAMGGRALAVRCNLADIAEVRAMLPYCVSRLGPISCLINEVKASLRTRLLNLSLALPNPTNMIVNPIIQFTIKPAHMAPTSNERCCMLSAKPDQ